MAMTEERKEYLKEYRNTKLKRIPLDIPVEMYNRMKARIEENGMSVNGFIKWLILKYLDRMDEEDRKKGLM